MWELILTLTEQDRPHGALFQYRSIETDVLGFILERATATSLLRTLVSRELWAPMGAQGGRLFHCRPRRLRAGRWRLLRKPARLWPLRADDHQWQDGLAIARSVPKASDRRRPATTATPNCSRASSAKRRPRAPITTNGGSRIPGGAPCWHRGIFGQLIYYRSRSPNSPSVKLSTWPEVTSVLPRPRGRRHRACDPRCAHIDNRKASVMGRFLLGRLLQAVADTDHRIGGDLLPCG